MLKLTYFRSTLIWKIKSNEKKILAKSQGRSITAKINNKNKRENCLTLSFNL